MCNHIYISNQFLHFWEAVQNGDRVVQEIIMIDFLGLFHILKKHRCFEITLIQIEREHRNATYKQLQEIRMNISFRYEHESKLNKCNKKSSSPCA